ncbi:uncharacterized protein E0L32_008881 [Thyridium curvatum]|uniref:DUF7888 domain-containing protein n=1 Tax=Thyridium curvatum TaxID=1093900 RepID=A0A507AXY0_9PEZI|nr:uncharacterized protein E0L32_008881 [Thyridium curvatum]TPX09859.1 hypothetical protein E0L32_008881 [Thyridium curvatum]
MRFSTCVLSYSLLTAAWGIALPEALKRDVSLTVHTDNETAQISVPTTSTVVTPNAVNGPAIGNGADVAGAVADIVDKVVNLIQKLVDNDIKRRQTFTQNVVARARQETGLNVIMSNVGYTFDGTVVSRTSTKYKAKVGSDVSFDVITFESGTFDLKGDGGFQNWAFIVSTTCQADAKAKHIRCP